MLADVTIIICLILNNYETSYWEEFNILLSIRKTKELFFIFLEKGGYQHHREHDVMDITHLYTGKESSETAIQTTNLHGMCTIQDRRTLQWVI